MANPAAPNPQQTDPLADLNQAAEHIWLACHEAWPTLSLEVRPELGSTNTELMQQGAAGHTNPTLLTAVHQTAGRGRLGRQWVAQPGDSLAFSLGLPLRFDTIPGGPSALSLAVGLAAAQALDTLLAHAWQTAWAHAPLEARPPAPPAIGLKWPNDLWLGTRKLGGILIEARMAPGLDDGTRWVVIGLGLNVHAAVFAGSASLANALPAPHTPTAGAVWTAVAPALLTMVAQYAQTGFAPLQTAFAQRDVLRNQPVALWARAQASAPGDPSSGEAPTEQGLALGLADDGSLLVQTSQGLRQWASGEVSVRPVS